MTYLRRNWSFELAYEDRPAKGTDLERGCLAIEREREMKSWKFAVSGKAGGQGIYLLLMSAVRVTKCFKNIEQPNRREVWLELKKIYGTTEMDGLQWRSECVT